MVSCASQVSKITRASDVNGVNRGTVAAQNDADNCVFQHGLTLADRLRQDTASYRRKRGTADQSTTSVGRCGGSAGKGVSSGRGTARQP